MSRFLAIVLPLLLLAFFTPAATADTALPAIPAPDASLVPAASPESAASSTAALVREINSARAAHGLKPVTLSGRLGRACRSYAGTMIREGRWAHAQRLRVKGFREVAEILARSTGPLGSAELVKAWLGSEVHRNALLGSRHRYVGVGTVRGTMGGKRTRVWVVRFAR